MVTPLLIGSFRKGSPPKRWVGTGERRVVDKRGRRRAGRERGGGSRERRVKVIGDETERVGVGKVVRL